MTAGSSAKLYTGEVLRLATELAQFPLADDLKLKSEVRSRTCGSSLAMGLDTNSDGAISNVGLRVSACAIGQAAAAIFARGATGRTPADIEHTRQAIQSWLRDEATPPDWPGLAAIALAREHPARHGAILLPWDAACAALSTGAFHR